MRACIAFIALVLASASAVAQTPQADQRHTGNITSRAPRASFNIELQAGQVVTLTTSSAENLDTVLTLNGPNGRAVAENDDVQQGVLSSRVIYVATASGRHTAIVSGYGGARGAFELRVHYGADVGLSRDARTLREETLTFGQGRTEARFPVDLNAGDILVASTFALTEGIDPTLTLLDANGAILGQSDDRGDGTLNSQIIHQVARGGRFEVVASTFGGAGVGNYVLSLAVDPNARAPLNFASIEGQPIARHEGQLNEAQPTREYNVELAAGQTLLAFSDATSGDLDTVLRLNSPEGLPVAINDDRGDGSLNSAVAFTAPAAGTYRLELYRFPQSNSSGGFNLVLLSVDRSVVDTLRAMVEEGVTLSGPELTIETQDFRVYYTLEGQDASTAAYAQGVANDLQRIIDVQLRRVGWAAPVREADGRYRAYIGQANGSMGYTKPIQIVFDNPSTPNVRESAAARAVFVIDNDFAGMGKKAPPESLARATATHEFNHMVQFGYDALEGLNWLYEATASWTETTTVGTDQDATDYVATDFAAPELCWTTQTQGFDYAQWTLLQSLADSYGEGIAVRLWENAVAHDGFDTMSTTLAGVGTTIPDALRRWRVQNFARDYDLAPLFTRSVRLGGTISRDGAFNPRDRIEQLGAQYIRVRFQGRRALAIRGDTNLEMVGLGRRGGQIEVIPLGRAATFDTTGYDYAAVMVFNRNVPATPGACGGVSFSISTSQSQAPMPAVEYRFDARHFAPPS